jgi:hypothetical protein
MLGERLDEFACVVEGVLLVFGVGVVQPVSDELVAGPGPSELYVPFS